MISSVLMVCTGNICRSPLAEYRFRQILVEQDKKVSSAGIHVLVDHPADSSAIYTAKENGLDLSPHKGRSISEEIIKNSDLILVMENFQKKFITENFSFSLGKVYLLGKWSDDSEIVDPYKKSIEMFRTVYEKINESCQQWIPYI